MSNGIKRLWIGRRKQWFAELVGIVVVAVVVAINYDNIGTRQIGALRILESSGARTHDDGQGRIVSVALNDRHVRPAALQSLAALPHVERVSLSRSNLPAGHFGNFSKMRNLRSLSLLDTPTSDSDVAQLQGCASLEVLSLDGTEITNEALHPLASLKNLQLLTLARTAIDDRVVDALAQLQGVREIDLRATNVTADGIERIRASHPDCEIHFTASTTRPETLTKTESPIPGVAASASGKSNRRS